MRGLHRAVPERVKLPPHPRQGFYAEVGAYELVPQRGLLDHVREVRRRLVVHAPPAVDEREPPVHHERPDVRPRRRILLFPPPGEERHLGVYERTFRVLRELVHDAGSDWY